MHLEKEAKLQQEAQTSDYLRRLVQSQAEQKPIGETGTRAARTSGAR